MRLGEVSRPRALTATQAARSSSAFDLSSVGLKHSRATSELAMSSNTSIPNQVVPTDLDMTKRRDYSLVDPSSKADLLRVSALNEVTNLNGQDLHQLALNSRSSQGNKLTGFMLDAENSAIQGGSFSVPTADAKACLEVNKAIKNDDCGVFVQEGSNQTVLEMAEKDTVGTGFTFDELVDGLLSLPMSKSDARFTAVFLCLYRKFAAPTELFCAILRRFELLHTNGEPQLLRISSQLRHLAILAQWISEYPGDFAHPLLHHHTSEIIKRLEANRVFAAAASEIRAQLDITTDDDDTFWACSDRNKGRASLLASFSTIPSIRNTVTTITMDQNSHDKDKGSQGTNESNARATQHSKASSSISSFDRPSSISGSSISTPLSSAEAAQRQAELLKNSGRGPLTKIQWHQFIESPNEDIAREMTRIDWIMYSSIRPRDLIRHVSLSPNEKEKCTGLGHVTRMINQFNHLAFWVANMILLRDKAKHRSQALEKFMDLAWVQSPSTPFLPLLSSNRSFVSLTITML